MKLLLNTGDYNAATIERDSPLITFVTDDYSLMWNTRLNELHHLYRYDDRLYPTSAKNVLSKFPILCENFNSMTDLRLLLPEYFL